MSTDLTLPLTPGAVRELRAGDSVTLSGEVLTGRDQACARLHQMVIRNEPLPVSLAEAMLYFVGPSPARPGAVIGSAGPTTSGRMNPFLPTLLSAGLRGFICKGFIAGEVKAALAARGGVYFGAIGGTGALLSQCIKAAEVIAFPELLSEAVHRLRISRFPAIVLHDARGGDVYERTYGEQNED
jgi:fumarate hydratase subunit beta